ncbi:Thioesterase/thiol ester dehydrase-isomerase [Hypoxylon sp. NC0597]|nr:Thioesterase/thiol ester dehydrase-isomerase [Hypoxylon sp. NC0597]
MSSSKPGPAVKPHSAPTDHNQPVPDPVAHFKAIPWCAALLSDPAVIDIIVPDRRPLPTGESSFVRKTMNTPTTIKACVTFYRMVKPLKPKSKSSSPSSGSTGDVSPAGSASPAGNSKEQSKSGEKKENKPLSASEALLSGGGKENGEDPRNPFILFNALADLGPDLQSFAGTMHGGLYNVLMDEVMGTAANFQASKCNCLTFSLLFAFLRVLNYFLPMKWVVGQGGEPSLEHGAYTITFTTNFRRAVNPPQVILIRGRVVKVDGRKIHVRGTVEDKDGNIMAEGSGIWLAMGRHVGRSQL